MSEIPAFILEGRYQYRNGEAARVLCTDSPGKWPIVSMDRDGNIYRHDTDGSFSDAPTCSWDLIEIPAEPAKPREFWIFDPDGKQRVYKSQQLTGLALVPYPNQIRVVEVPPGWSDPRPPENGPLLEDATHLRELLVEISGELWSMGDTDKVHGLRRKIASALDADSPEGHELIGAGPTKLATASKPLPPGIPQPPEKSNSNHAHVLKLINDIDMRAAKSALEKDFLSMNSIAPAPPEGCEILGIGPIKRVELNPEYGNPDLFVLSGGGAWIPNAFGDLRGSVYAARIGSEIHRLNSGEVVS